MKRADLINELNISVISKYPSLVLYAENPSVFLRGIFPLLDLSDKSVIDKYELEIEFPQSYPKSLPIVRETAGRIPIDIDRHMIPENRQACFFLVEERYLHFPIGSPIIKFIDGPMYQFFLSQTYYELTGKWIFGEHRHGIYGIYDYYAELLNTKDLNIIIKFVDYVSKKKIKSYWPCYCSKNKRLDECHLKFLLKTRSQIPPRIAKNSFIRLNDLYQQELMLYKRKIQKILEDARRTNPHINIV